jgi:multiple sugar transport system permease protein
MGSAPVIEDAGIAPEGAAVRSPGRRARRSSGATPAEVPISRRGRRLGWGLVVPALIVLILVNAAPLIYGTVLAFYHWSLVDPSPPRFVGLQNFIDLITGDTEFQQAAIQTLKLMVIALPIEGVLGLAIAVLLDQGLFGSRLVGTLLLVPMTISSAIIGFLFGTLFDESLGPINYLLSLAGIPGPAWLSSPALSLPSIALVDAWQWTPFLVLIYLAGLRSLPTEPIEAAKADGAGPWQRFWYVTLPLLAPILFLGLLLRAMDLFKTFDIIYLLTYGGPGTSSEVLSFYGYKTGFLLFQIGYGSAISFLMVQVFILFIVIYYRLARQEL